MKTELAALDIVRTYLISAYTEGERGSAEITSGLVECGLIEKGESSWSRDKRLIPQPWRSLFRRSLRAFCSIY